MQAPRSTLGIYHRHRGEFITALRAAVLTTSQYDVLPEVVEIFEDQALKFLRIFSGSTITVPAWRDVTERFKQVTAWIALSHADDAERRRLEPGLAAEFGVSRKEIRAMFDGMEALMSNLGMELRHE